MPQVSGPCLNPAFRNPPKQLAENQHHVRYRATVRKRGHRLPQRCLQKPRRPQHRFASSSGEAPKTQEHHWGSGEREELAS